MRQHLIFQEVFSIDEMIKLLDKLYNEKIILDHGMKVATELANVLSGGDTSMQGFIRR